jgi:hypothetical protein
MLITPNCCAISGSSSTLILQTFAFFTRSKLLDNRGDHPAGAAPACPEIYENGHLRIQYLLLKGLLCYIIAIPDTPFLIVIEPG